MNANNWVWEVRGEDQILGKLTAYGWYDYPWIGCRFEPTDKFEAYQHLFNDSLKLLEAGDVEKLDTLTDEINQLIKLIPLNKETPLINEYSLYIEGKETRLRAIFMDEE